VKRCQLDFDSTYPAQIGEEVDSTLLRRIGVLMRVRTAMMAEQVRLIGWLTFAASRSKMFSDRKRLFCLD
jgi:hypothetical protein